MTKEMDLLKGDCDIAYKIYCEAREYMLICRKEWNEYRLQYEAADRELAEIDGRLNKVSTASTREKKAEPPTLTMEQIKMLADRVGIKLDFDGED